MSISDLYIHTYTQSHQHVYIKPIHTLGKIKGNAKIYQIREWSQLIPTVCVFLAPHPNQSHLHNSKIILYSGHSFSASLFFLHIPGHFPSILWIFWFPRCIIFVESQGLSHLSIKALTIFNYDSLDLPSEFLVFYVCMFLVPRKPFNNV